MNDLPRHYVRGPHRAQDGRLVWLVMRRVSGLHHAGMSLGECLTADAAADVCHTLNHPGDPLPVTHERRAA